VSEDPATHDAPKFIAAAPAMGRFQDEIGQRFRRRRGEKRTTQSALPMKPMRRRRRRAHIVRSAQSKTARPTG
jgi:hypothetical protein